MVSVSKVRISRPSAIGRNARLPGDMRRGPRSRSLCIGRCEKLRMPSTGISLKLVPSSTKNRRRFSYPSPLGRIVQRLYPSTTGSSAKPYRQPVRFCWPCTGTAGRSRSQRGKQLADLGLEGAIADTHFSGRANCRHPLFRSRPIARANCRHPLFRSRPIADGQLQTPTSLPIFPAGCEPKLRGGPPSGVHAWGDGRKARSNSQNHWLDLRRVVDTLVHYCRDVHNGR